MLPPSLESALLEAHKLIARPLLRAALVTGLVNCLPAYAQTEVQKLNGVVEQLLKRMEQLEGKLFEQVQKMPDSFQSELKGEMNKLGDRFRPENATVAVGSVSAGVAARQLNGFDTASLYGPPGQSEEEAKAAQLRAQAKRNEWLEQGVQGDLTDALVFEQNNWAAQRLQQQPSPELAAYKAKSDEYIGLQTVMRQGQGLSSGDPDVFDRSAYAQRQAGKA